MSLTLLMSSLENACFAIQHDSTRIGQCTADTGVTSANRRLGSLAPWPTVSDLTKFSGTLDPDNHCLPFSDY